MLKKFEKNPQDEIAQLYYNSINVKSPSFEFKEHFVAVGKGKPQITAVVKVEEKLNLQNMQWTLPYEYTDKNSGKVVR